MRNRQIFARFFVPVLVFSYYIGIRTFSVLLRGGCDTEKLDEIVEKYGLKLHTAENIIDSHELMYWVGGDFMDEESLSWAYIYEDGYFHAEGEVELPMY